MFIFVSQLFEVQSLEKLKDEQVQHIWYASVEAALYWQREGASITKSRLFVKITFHLAFSMARSPFKMLWTLSSSSSGCTGRDVNQMHPNCETSSIFIVRRSPNCKKPFEIACNGLIAVSF